MMASRSTESVTFRVDSERLQKLRNEAQDNQVSLNTLVNQVLSSFVDWDMIASKAGWEMVSKDVLKELLDAIDEERLKVIAKKCAATSKDHSLMLGGKDDIDSFCDVTRYRIKKSGYVLREYDDDSNRTKKLAVQHEMGMKWSIFFKEYYTHVINGLGHSAEVEISPNSIVMTIV